MLELIVLLSVNKKDMYGYELVEEVSKVVDVNDGTIYPLLKRLTILGKEKMKDTLENWSSFEKAVNKFIKECGKND